MRLLELVIEQLSVLLAHLEPVVAGIAVAESVRPVVRLVRLELVVVPTVLGRQPDVLLLRRQLVERLEPELLIVLDKQLLVQPVRLLVVRQLVRQRLELV